MRYVTPASLQEATEFLERETGVSRVLAGGTDVLVQLRAGMIQPDLIVDIKKLDGADQIAREDGGFRIGAAVPGAVMGEDGALKAAWPGVVEAMELIGSTQVQGRATLAGNLCNASPAADSVPALVAADAVVRLHCPAGPRECPVAEIPAGPGKTTLAKGEFVTSIFLPARPERSGDAYLRFTPRTEMDIAVASAAVSLTLDADGICTDARVAIGAVAATVLLLPKAAACLIGTPVDDAALAALAAACTAAASPIDDKRGTVEFRKTVVGVLARRAATLAKTRAGGAS